MSILPAKPIFCCPTTSPFGKAHRKACQSQTGASSMPRAGWLCKAMRSRHRSMRTSYGLRTIALGWSGCHSTASACSIGLAPFEVLMPSRLRLGGAEHLTWAGWPDYNASPACCLGIDCVVGFDSKSVMCCTVSLPWAFAPDTGQIECFLLANRAFQRRFTLSATFAGAPVGGPAYFQAMPVSGDDCSHCCMHVVWVLPGFEPRLGARPCGLDTVKWNVGIFMNSWGRARCPLYAINLGRAQGGWRFHVGAHACSHGPVIMTDMSS